MIEPTRLVSRLMTFVLAGCLTVLIVLVATLAQMFPLERTQIFFLTSKPVAGQMITIQKFDVGQQNIKTFKEIFVKEYITARNQIEPSNAAMRRKWGTDAGGLVYAYSSIGVYKEFMNTDFWYVIMEGRYEPLTFRCDVTFLRPIMPRETTENYEKFAASFKYVCKDERTGQTLSKDFTIAVSLAFQTNLNWNERLDNPLGLKVVGYGAEDGEGDPLNALQWLQALL